MPEVLTVTPFIKISNSTILGFYRRPDSDQPMILSEDYSGAKTQAKVVGTDIVEFERLNGDKIWQSRQVHGLDINNDPDLIGRLRFGEFRKLPVLALYFRFF